MANDVTVRVDLQMNGTVADVRAGLLDEQLAQRVERLGLHFARAAREQQRKQKILAVAQGERLVVGVFARAQ